MSDTHSIPSIYKSPHYMPHYQPGEYGQWCISILPFGHDHGYFTGTWMVKDMPVLMRKCDKGWSTWMSLSPHEMESQELGFKYAFGHTVVMGLGMGWVAINAALNPNVQKVTVVELDPDVISLFNQSGAAQRLSVEIISKVNIVQGDALRWRPEDKVDFLYADIWLRLNEPQVMEDMRSMQNNVQADAAYFWGQELVLYNLVQSLSDGTQWDLLAVKKIITESLQLPLILPDGAAYIELIKQVVENRIKRGILSKNS
ncbi:hypothetical protein KAR48_05400 [bacterium]|nr:hypothetical protein [bacterium]